MFVFLLSLHTDMAPRKRTTKQKKNNPKTAKLEAFLEDFDSEGDFILFMVKKQHCSMHFV